MNYDKSSILNKLFEVKPLLQNEFGVKKIGLFGSYVTGKQSDDSDIDIFVEFEKPIGWKFFTLEKYLENLFQKKIDLVSKNALKSQLKEEILSSVNYV